MGIIARGQITITYQSDIYNISLRSQSIVLQGDSRGADFSKAVCDIKVEFNGYDLFPNWQHPIIEKVNGLVSCNPYNSEISQNGGKVTIVGDVWLYRCGF